MSAIVELDCPSPEAYRLTRPDYEGAFDFHTETGEISTAGATCSYRLDIPDEPIDETVNVIIYGFAGSDAAYRGLATAMTAEQGLPTLSLRLSRFQHPKAAFSFKHLREPIALTSKLVHGAIKQLPVHGFEDRVNLFGHSMGGWIGTELAAHKPDRVKTLTLVGSAGLIDHDVISLAPRMPRLVGRIALDLIRRRPEAVSPQNACDSLRHIIANPFLTTGEMVTVAHCDIREQLRNGIEPRLVVIHPENDELFDAQTVGTSAKEFTNEVYLLDGLGHAAPITHPSDVASSYASVLLR